MGANQIKSTSFDSYTFARDYFDKSFGKCYIFYDKISTKEVLIKGVSAEMLNNTNLKEEEFKKMISLKHPHLLEFKGRKRSHFLLLAIIRCFIYFI
jgi:hypothetical protein